MQKFVILFAILGLTACAPSQDVTRYETVRSELTLIVTLELNLNTFQVFDIFSRLCVTMLPEHSGEPRRPEPFPVTIVRTPDQSTYSPGQTILITLRGDPGFMFTGFLIQARHPGQNVPYGHWVAGATATVAGCRDPQPDFSGDDTGAHSTGSIRNIQEMVFTMPQELGQYHFELTTVERFGVYWMYQFSTPFNVV